MCSHLKGPRWDTKDIQTLYISASITHNTSQKQSKRLSCSYGSLHPNHSKQRQALSPPTGACTDGDVQLVTHPQDLIWRCTSKGKWLPYRWGYVGIQESTRYCHLTVSYTNLKRQTSHVESHTDTHALPTSLLPSCPHPPLPSGWP